MGDVRSGAVRHGDTEQLRLIERHANETATWGREITDVGPFRAMLDPGDDMVWINYAVPTEQIGDDESVSVYLDRLREVFERSSRTPRFEFLEGLWPDLGSLLEENGFTLQVRHPLMVCAPGDLRPVEAPGVTVHMLTPEDDDETLGKFLAARNEGFSFEDVPSRPVPEEIARLRADLQEGSIRCASGLLDGVMAGVAATTLVGEVAELVGVATRPAFRRRGVASTVSSRLTQDHFDRGGTLVWLSAGDEAAYAVYAGIGFRLIGARLNYIAE